MEPETLVGKLEPLIKSGNTNGRPWAIVRFKDLWEAGFDTVRRDKLEDALQTVLKNVGIDLEFDPKTETLGYATFVSAKGVTVYVGKTELTDWISTGDLFEAVKDVVEDN